MQQQLRGIMRNLRRSMMARLSRQNPWLAGRPAWSTPPRTGMLRPTTPARMVPQFALPFQHLVLIMPIHYHMWQMVQFTIGKAYPIVPWFMLWCLVMYCFMYGTRVTDYDRGFTQFFNFSAKLDADRFLSMVCTVDHLIWCSFFQNWVKKEKDVDGVDWVYDEDHGCIQPSEKLVSPGGLAAFHIMDGTSLRRELTQRRDRWTRNWAKAGHEVYITPTWVFGATQDVHARNRTFVGDWCDESWPWTRCYGGPTLWPTPVEF
eukprot:TRINITY_DN17013_c0_g1_i1.p1 TRINITY_DN17013_c0_g1~~TRINITY_DN17013_c0_g1_i1.p1  ORF type:complete len:261 (+),score=76.45 TRINITY_DN17013_c0_g1_i1:99-881(+)